jgi:hypothetical protein
VDGRLVHAQGALAQLVARFHGMEEVRGSSPLSSTLVMSRDTVDRCVGTSLHFGGYRSGWMVIVAVPGR